MTVQEVSRPSDKPALIHTEDGLPEEVTLELRKGNLVRAVGLAIEKAVPRERVRELQSDAIR
jgi:hypothetical protein